MAGSQRIMRRYPAFLCAVIALLCSTFDASAQRRYGPSPLDTLGEDPDQNLGAEILNHFRSLGIAGDYRFDFQLKIMPRRDKSQYLEGKLFGARGVTGPLTRIDIVDDSGETRLLLQNGWARAAWVYRSHVDQTPVLLDRERYFEPLVGSDLTAFDLLMPYIFWERYFYEGRTSFRGRPTHLFWMYPPADDAALSELVSGVRLYIDDAFNVLIQVELFGPEKETLKTVSIIDFKKAQGQWIVGAFDARNEETRDKTRFKVLDAQMDLEVDKGLFLPEGLSAPISAFD